MAAEAALDKARGAVVADQERNQAERTDAIDGTVDNTSMENALMMQIAVEKKRILRWSIPRRVVILIVVMIAL